MNKVMLTNQRKEIQKLRALIDLKKIYKERIDKAAKIGNALEYAEYSAALTQTEILIRKFEKQIDSN
jgi:hypothetical protein